MKNVNITIQGAQGSGKTTLGADLLKLVNTMAERQYTHTGAVGTCHEVAEVLRVEAADAVIFDGCLANPKNHADAVAGVELYRQITNRKVTAVFIIQTNI